MPAEKNESIILSVSAYRETSCILRLFTRTRGLIHGIAKGARRAGGKSSAPTPLDRGFLLESLLYYRPNRELHTLGSLHTKNFFPNIRSDITKSTIRDIALELYLKTITQSDPHPELFDLLAVFLTDMDNLSKPEITFPLLWRFIRKYCLLAGFGIDTKTCASCGMDVRYGVADAMSAIGDKYCLEIDSGALVCGKCASSKTGAYDNGIGRGAGIDSAIDGSIIRFMDETGNDLPHYPPKNESLRITELLLSYVRSHFDVRAPFNSFEFVKSM